MDAEEIRASQGVCGGTQQKVQAYPTGEKPQLGPLTGQGLRIAPLWKGRDLQKGPASIRASAVLLMALMSTNYTEPSPSTEFASHSATQTFHGAITFTTVFTKALYWSPS